MYFKMGSRNIYYISKTMAPIIYCVFFKIFHVLQLFRLISFDDVVCRLKCFDVKQDYSILRLNLDEIILGEAGVVDCGQHDFDHYNNYHGFSH